MRPEVVDLPRPVVVRLPVVLRSPPPPRPAVVVSPLPPPLVVVVTRRASLVVVGPAEVVCRPPSLVVVGRGVVVARPPSEDVVVSMMRRLVVPRPPPEDVVVSIGAVVVPRPVVVPLPPSVVVVVALRSTVVVRHVWHRIVMPDRAFAEASKSSLNLSNPLLDSEHPFTLVEESIVSAVVSMRPAFAAAAWHASAVFTSQYPASSHIPNSPPSALANSCPPPPRLSVVVVPPRFSVVVESPPPPRAFVVVVVMMRISVVVVVVVLTCAVVVVTVRALVVVTHVLQTSVALVDTTAEDVESMLKFKLPPAFMKHPGTSVVLSFCVTEVSDNARNCAAVPQSSSTSIVQAPKSSHTPSTPVNATHGSVTRSVVVVDVVVVVATAVVVAQALQTRVDDVLAATVDEKSML